MTLKNTNGLFLKCRECFQYARMYTSIESYFIEGDVDCKKKVLCRKLLWIRILKIHLIKWFMLLAWEQNSVYVPLALNGDTLTETEHFRGLRSLYAVGTFMCHLKTSWMYSSYLRTKMKTWMPTEKSHNFCGSNAGHARQRRHICITKQVSDSIHTRALRSIARLLDYG